VEDDEDASIERMYCYDSDDSEGTTHNVGDVKLSGRMCSYHRCNKVDCSQAMSCIPMIPTKLPTQFNNHNYERLYRSAKLVHRSECLRHIGVASFTNNIKDYRICKNHRTIISKPVEYEDLKGAKKTVSVNMNVPVAYDDPGNLNGSSCGDDNAVVISTERDSRISWRSKIDDAKRLAAELSAQLGIDEQTALSTIITQMKRSRADVSNSIVDTPLINNNQHNEVPVESNKRIK
jgi:hypothetical protein